MDPTALVPGRDLVLRLHPVHGTDAPEGTALFDHLDGAGREAADATTVATLEAWRATLAQPLTADGIDWAFVWMVPLYYLLNEVVPPAIALDAALRALAPDRIVLADTDEQMAALARAVAGPLGLAVQRAPDARQAQPPRTIPPPVSRLRRARRATLGSLLRLGAPSLVRTGAIAVHSYWPLMPLLDRMLERDGDRPAMFLGKRPTGVSRSVRTAVRGGWVGQATVLDLRRAARRAGDLVDAAARAGAPAVGGIDLTELLSPGLRTIVAGRAVGDLAERRMLRRAFARRRRPAWVVGAYETDPKARLLLVTAKEAGVRTLMLAHGAFVLPQPFADLDHCDEVAIWSWDIAPAITNRDRPIHVVGYPLPHRPPPPTRVRPRDRPLRIGVLGQLPVWASCTLDARITMVTYETVLQAVRRRYPGATVVLRPHPAQDRAAGPEIVRRYPDLDVQERVGGDILGFHHNVDLCIGSASTATLQAVLAGTPALVLNLSGSAWPFPLGGRTTVPVATSATELDAILDRWDADGTLPGREDLITALGVDGSDATDRLLAVLGA